MLLEFVCRHGNSVNNSISPFTEEAPEKSIFVTHTHTKNGISAGYIYHTQRVGTTPAHVLIFTGMLALTVKVHQVQRHKPDISAGEQGWRLTGQGTH